MEKLAVSGLKQREVGGRFQHTSAIEQAVSDDSLDGGHSNDDGDESSQYSEGHHGKQTRDETVQKRSLGRHPRDPGNVLT